ncbi:MAG: hypothetical protein ACLFRT_10440 [Actinomycetota bacterium]
MEIPPRKFGDALNEWFRSLGRNWKPLLLSSLVVHVPIGVVVTLAFWLFGATDAFALYLDSETLETMSDAEIIETLAPFLWAMGVWMVLQMLGAVFVYVASARTVAGDMSGTGFSWFEVSRFAWRKTLVAAASILLVVLGAVVLAGVATAIGWSVISAGGATFFTVFVTATAGLTALVILVWLGVSVTFGSQVIAIEDTGPASALARSFSLVQRRWWVTLGYVLVTALIVSAASQIISIGLVPLLLIGTAVPAVLGIAFGASAVLQGPLLAVIAAAYAIWYVDLRARKEPLLADQLV